MRRGPKPTPTHTLKLRKSTLAPGRADLNDPDVEAPACPSWLTKEAKAEWKRVVPILKARGTIQKLDRAMLVSYCMAMSEYREFCEMIIKRLGLGEPAYRNPFNLRDKAWNIMYRTAMELGLSPASRTRVPMKKRSVEPKKGSGLAARLADGG